MRLPVEQYFVLDPKQIRHLGANRFLLLVPRIQILNVWLEPEVEISVSTIGGKVVLQAENCRIRGSELIENLRLDERFCMRFSTELTWQESRAAPHAPHAPHAAASVASNGSGAPAGSSGTIRGEAQLQVWCEVIPPFNLMPREVLVSTSNAVMHGLVGTLLPLFLRNLGRDYEVWAHDLEYRQTRAQRSKPLHEPQPALGRVA